MNRKWTGVLLSCLFSAAAAKDVNIADLGIKPDSGKTCTVLLQQTIDDCSSSGGGQVYIPAGTYLTGALLLKNNVELHVSKGACLKGSTNFPEDYPNSPGGLIVGNGVSNCAITGLGLIDGQGGHANFMKYRKSSKVNFIDYDKGAICRPHAIYFKDCKQMTIKDVRIRDAGFWTVRLFRCDGVTIDNVNIYGQAIINNDGIDIDARNVTVSNCRIDSDDDGICLKSDDPDFMPENITVTNCTIASNCNPIKLGTSSHCGFRNITFSNCVIHKTSESNVWDWSTVYREIKKGEMTGLAGIAVEAVDGGHIENLHFSNISMTGVITPIFVCLNKRKGTPGSIRNVIFSGITAKANGIIPTLIAGIPGTKVDGITLRDIIVEHVGKGTAKDAAKPLAENLKGYPENRMYGNHNPAYGLFIRHANNITIDNFQVRILNPDARPAVVMDDVSEMSINNFKNISSTFAEPLIRLNNCQDCRIGYCRNDNDKSGTLLQVTGKDSSDILCLYPWKERVKIDPSAPPTSVLQQ